MQFRKRLTSASVNGNRRLTVKQIDEDLGIPKTIGSKILSLICGKVSTGSFTTTMH